MVQEIKLECTMFLLNGRDLPTGQHAYHWSKTLSSFFLRRCIKNDFVEQNTLIVEGTLMINEIVRPKKNFGQRLWNRNDKDFTIIVEGKSILVSHFYRVTYWARFML